jgi:hypothetical protein
MPENPRPAPGERGYSAILIADLLVDPVSLVRSSEAQGGSIASTSASAFGHRLHPHPLRINTALYTALKLHECMINSFRDTFGTRLGEA